MTHDCIIIGAGMSGLAAGIRLAMFGKRVCIVERHYTAGGLNSYYSKGGRLFDVGLHAMTNYVPAGAKGRPLSKLLRQLRIRHEELGLEEQRQSSVRFPGATLRFTNDFEVLRQEVRERFPAEIDGFNRLVAHVEAYDEVALDRQGGDTRPVLREYINDPLLVDMLLCPLMFYGSARENEIDFDQFVILFKSIYMEGFARPREGVRRIVKLLVNKFKELGGELRMKCPVERLETSGGRVAGVVLEGGETLRAERVISSIGVVETLRLCDDYDNSQEANEGRFSFVETISCLNRQPRELGHEDTIVFFSTTERFHYEKPDDPVDVRSGVICCPNNYQNHDGLEGMIRLTHLADPGFWMSGLDDFEYHRKKEEWYEASLASVATVVPPFKDHVSYIDAFTPRTVHHFTAHARGAVYGAPSKFKQGTTKYGNLFLCGTDQGFLGIVGAVLSGISMANLHILKSELAV